MVYRGELVTKTLITNQVFWLMSLLYISMWWDICVNDKPP